MWRSDTIPVSSGLSAPRWRAALGKPALPVLFFLAGVTYDTVTLTRIDRLIDNLILLSYLLLLGVLIVLSGRWKGARPAPGQSDEGAVLASGIAMALAGRVRPYAPMAMQFLLGSLFSAYTIYYSRSASWSTTAVFFGVLVGLLVANEFLRDRLTGLRLLLSLYALVTFSFFTFFLPVVTGWMNTPIFLLGALLSAAATLTLARLASGQVWHWRRRDSWLSFGLPVALIALLVAGYFLKLIPPVPLSLKYAGIYQEVTKSGERYQLSFEEPRWYELFKRSERRYRGQGPLYCFTAVFAPVALNTTVYHHWQYRTGAGRGHGYATSDRIPITISGGRDAGYRGYTVKSRVIPGDWRVDVETEDGRLIGRVTFRVEEPSGEARGLATMVY